MKKTPQHRNMQFRVEYDKHPPIRAMVLEDEAAMCKHLDSHSTISFCVGGREMRASAPLGTGSGDLRL